jgi:hypothetical protein
MVKRERKPCVGKLVTICRKSRKKDGPRKKRKDAGQVRLNRRGKRGMPGLAAFVAS